MIKVPWNFSLGLSESSSTPSSADRAAMTTSPIVCPLYNLGNHEPGGHFLERYVMTHLLRRSIIFPLNNTFAVLEPPTASTTTWPIWSMLDCFRASAIALPIRQLNDTVLAIMETCRSLARCGRLASPTNVLMILLSCHNAATPCGHSPHLDTGRAHGRINVGVFLCLGHDLYNVIRAVGF